MYLYDDKELKAYFGFYDEDDITIVNRDCGHDSSSSNIESKIDGCYCRSCNEYYKFSIPDNVIDDGKITCWTCMNHPERKKFGLPADKIKDLEAYYKKNYKTYR